MAELSNAVTVLIARMESHPEDFDMYNGELYNKAKFGETAGALYGLAGLDEGKKYAYWFLNDADKEALLEAWKKYHRTRMEKEVMEKIFDDGQAGREAEIEKVRQKVMMQQMQQRAMMQNSTLQPGQIHPVQNTGGLIGSSYPYGYTDPRNAMHGQGIANAAQNSSGNTGLFGSAGSALQGLFK